MTDKPTFDELMETSPELARMVEMMHRKEDLHPDLVPHLRDHPTLGMMLHHPLVINVMHTPNENARMNAAYLAKKEAIETAKAEKDWGRFVMMHERPYRLDAILAALDEGLEDDPKAYWKLVGWAWTDSENINESLDEWIDLWTATVASREIVMTEEERAALAALPETITVYRGFGHEDAVHGLSWTTDETKARWFAKRFAKDGHTPHLATGIVQKNDVMAYLTGRNESEIVVLFDDVMDIAVNQI